MPRVARLFYYPVKSLGGIETKRLELTPRGPKWDREWMVVGPDGRFLSQREHPRMGRVATALEGGSLRLSTGGASLSVPFEARGARRRVVVWDDPCDALDAGDEAAAWLSEFLGTPCRLVRFAPDFRRAVAGGAAETAFADGGPVLVVSEESLADLGRRAGRAFEAERFRPNVVVAGTPAWAEDGWTALKADGLTLRSAQACARCAIVGLDPATGAAGPEPLKTLASFRRGAEGGVDFGVYCVPEGAGTLSVGDALRA